MRFIYSVLLFNVACWGGGETSNGSLAGFKASVISSACSKILKFYLGALFCIFIFLTGPYLSFFEPSYFEAYGLAVTSTLAYGLFTGYLGA